VPASRVGVVQPAQTSRHLTVFPRSKCLARPTSSRPVAALTQKGYLARFPRSWTSELVPAQQGHGTRRLYPPPPHRPRRLTDAWSGQRIPVMRIYSRGKPGAMVPDQPLPRDPTDGPNGTGLNVASLYLIRLGENGRRPWPRVVRVGPARRATISLAQGLTEVWLRTDARRCSARRACTRRGRRKRQDHCQRRRCQVYGGGGGDRIRGGRGGDVLRGNMGDDVILAGPESTESRRAGTLMSPSADLVTTL
jgi:hypothetical protein